MSTRPPDIKKKRIKHYSSDVLKKTIIAEPKTYWVANKLQMWDRVGIAGHRLPFPVQFAKPSNDEIGFLPVFSTLESALIYVGGDRSLVTKIQEVAK
jgi:hypothetical protein